MDTNAQYEDVRRVGNGQQRAHGGARGRPRRRALQVERCRARHGDPHR